MYTELWSFMTKFCSALYLENLLRNIFAKLNLRGGVSCMPAALLLILDKVNRWWVPCVRNSSYSFIPILLKLYRCCDHALKICMWFGYNPQINFCHFFRNLNLAIFRAFSQCK